MQYLGHVISEDGVAVDPSKIEAILEWPTPKSVRAVRGFLGLAGYYRKFIRNFGAISAPLNHLLSKDGFHWSGMAAESFYNLKMALYAKEEIWF